MKENGKKMSVRGCSIVTNLTHIDLDKMKIQLEERKCITHWAYIIHDKDVYTKEDEEKDPLKKEGDLKTPHIHLLLKFDVSQKIDFIAKWFDIQESRIEKFKGKFMTNLMYLTHMNAEDKYQYDSNEVFCNFNYSDYTDISKIGTASSKSVREREIIELINNETIREYNISEYITAHEYVKHNRAITTSLNYTHNRLENKKGRDMKVIYINGKSGNGKTTYAKMIADTNEMSYFISSSSNDVLDGYKGQDCLILDDLRASSLALPDLLKLLDNHTNSSVKSRFKNKNLVYCKLIIITTIQPLEVFFKQLEQNENEDITQLKRRIGTIVELTNKLMNVYEYNSDRKDHLLTYSNIENPIIEYLKELEKEKEKRTNETMKMLGIKKKTSETKAIA